MKRRIISFLTSFIMIFSLVAYAPLTSVHAESTTSGNQNKITANNGDVSIEGTNSFGNLLTSVLTEKIDQQEENNGCNIFSVEMVETSMAAVSFETLQDCMLVVGIYDEAGEALLASGSLEVYAGETDTYVDIETDNMPEYFYIKAFLIDYDCFRPLCNAYESPNYTQEMQEFFAKTTDDFNQEKVLNFDDDKINNFAVFSEDTTIIPKTEDTNNVVTADDENNTYIIENVDSSITSLKVGETFAYSYGDNDVLIVKVADIKIDGTTATITGEDTSLEEAFDYIKIDTESNSADAQIDASNLEEGITYEGTVESEDDSEVQTYDVELGGSAEVSHSFDLLDKKLGSAKVSGSVDLKISVSAKVYVSLNYQYIELKLDYSAKAVLSLSGKDSGKLILAEWGFMPIPGLIIEIAPSIVVETSVKIEVSGTLKGCVGFRASNTEGMVNLTKTPTFKPEVKIEGTIFVGISLEPRIKVIDERIASVSMTAKAGVEVKGVLSKLQENKADASSIHECKNCIDGEIKGKITLSFEAKLVNWDKTKFTLNLVDWSVKISDFHYSFDYGEFDFTSCPHYKYKVTISVTDPDANKVEGATVKIGYNEYETDEDGCIIVYLHNGSYKLSAEKSKVGKAQITLIVRDNTVKQSVCLSPDSPISSASGTAWKISAGYHEHKAVITTDGSLYTWGENSYGQLGNGTINERYDADTYNIPRKIMDNVQEVSLGNKYSAAITTDGSLYTWGSNSYGQLGDGTTTDSPTPIKIMDNVKAVSLSSKTEYDRQTAAITTDGSLYMWGRNDDGQLGDGTTTDSSVPVKIMENVQSVSLGWECSAAITTDGSLYIWGDAGYDNGMASLTPAKILDDVQSVSMGYSQGAAITTDGSLYTWGYEYLGDGKYTYNSTPVLTPIKIMDNVQSVEKGSTWNAALTTDGCLYTWGTGYLGDGTYHSVSKPVLTPTKIMENVQSMSLHKETNTAITTDGDLYIWGSCYVREYGKYYGGETTHKRPMKIMENVQSVSQPNYFGMAITTDGSVYQWGNYYKSVTSGISWDNHNYVPSKVTIPAKSSTQFAATQLNPISTFSIESFDSNTQVKRFNGMRADETYNVYAIKSADVDNIFDADNLLYITQTLSDEEGIIDVPYGLDEEYDNPIWFAVPMTQLDISSAQITVDNLAYTGETQFVNPVVRLNGKKLVEGEEYYLENEYSAVELGEYTVVVTGCGLYKGSVEVTYNVVRGVTLRGSNLTLNGNIGLNFYFEFDELFKDSIFEDETAILRFTLADGSTEDVKVDTGEKSTDAIEGLTLYRYSCELTAKQMADTVNVQFIRNGNVIAEYEHSVVDYAKIIIANAQNAYSEDDIALVKAMINYGANAQLNFGYNTENLANSLTDSDGNAMITEDEKDLSSVTAATFEPYKATGKTVDGLGTFAAANLVLKSETTLKVYFKPEDGITLDMLTFKVGNNKVTATEYGEYFMIDIPNIKASALDNKYVITVTSNTDSTKTGTFDAYVYSYCYSILNDSTGTYTEQLKDTLRALYLFNVAANKCFK